MFTKHGKQQQKRPLLATLATLGLTAAAIAATGTPASAETTGNTTVTFELTNNNGGLAITVPSSPVALNQGAIGGADPSGSLGEVTVVDSRAALGASWTATASATDFITGAATGDDLTARTIPNEEVFYTPGGLVDSVGVIADTVLTGAVATPGAGGAMGVSQTVYSVSATVGNNEVTWAPTISVNVPAQAIAGSYTGTITHSVTGTP